MAPDAPELLPLAQITGGGDTWRTRLPHTQDDHLLLWIVRGHGSALVDGLRFGIAPHTLVFLPAGTLFALETGPQAFGSGLVLPVSAGISLPDEAQCLRVPSLQDQAELNALLEAMTREQRAKREFHGAAACAHAALVAIWLRRTLLAQPSPAKLRADQRLTRRFARLLVRDYRSGKPMADYAAELGVTATHLTRASKRASGMSAAEMLTGRSLHAARQLLSDSTLPISQVARHLGFGSAAYFTRFIQNHTNRTPSKLRADAAARHATSR